MGGGRSAWFSASHIRAPPDLGESRGVVVLHVPAPVHGSAHCRLDGSKVPSVLGEESRDVQESFSQVCYVLGPCRPGVGRHLSRGGTRLYGDFLAESDMGRECQWMECRMLAKLEYWRVVVC